jgi:hypothetical protein
VQTLTKKKHYHWNDDLNCVLIKLLEIYSNPPLKYIVQLFNSSCNINVTKSEVRNHIQYTKNNNLRKVLLIIVV